jgi:HAD superfamily hydrolase (TIGR01450 family)
MRNLENKSLFLFDLDGVFYKGKESRVKLGGSRVIRKLRLEGKKIFVLTNNSTDSVATIHSRLMEFSIDVAPEEILSSARLTADYLKSHKGVVTYFLVGEHGLEAEMRGYGHRRTEGDFADCVVVGLDRGLTYEKLDHAAKLVRSGASIIATHCSRLYMYKTGPAVAAGPIVKSIEYATGRRATVIGKPSPHMFKMALSKAGCTKEEAVMIGDQLETDVLGAARAGIDSILVTSGVDRDAKGFKVLATIPNVDRLVEYLG